MTPEERSLLLATARGVRGLLVDECRRNFSHTERDDDLASLNEALEAFLPAVIPAGTV